MNRILFLGGLHCSEGELKSALSPPCFSYKMWYIYLMQCGSVRGRNQIVCWAEMKRSNSDSQYVGEIIWFKPAVHVQPERLSFHFLCRYSSVSPSGLIECLSCIFSAMNFLSVTITLSLEACVPCSKMQYISSSTAVKCSTRTFIYIPIK